MLLSSPNRSAQNELMSLFQILEEDRSFVVIENTEEISDDDPPPEPKPGEVIKVRGSLVSFIDRLDDELTKSLQNIDPHTPEYIERLRDEQSLYAVVTRGGIWFERVEKEGFDTGGSASRIALRRLEHIYYKVTLAIASSNSSQCPSLRTWRRLLGKVFLRTWTPPLPLAPPHPRNLSKSYAYTFTNMDKSCSVPEQYYTTSTMLPSKTNSIVPAICS